MNKLARPKARTSNFTRGGQIFFHNWRMYFQIIGNIFHWYALAVIVLTLGIAYLSIDAETIASLKYYFQAKWSLNTNNTIIVHANGADFPYTAQQLCESPTLNAIVDRAWIILQFSFVFAFIIVTGVMTLIMRYFRKKGEEQTADCLVRGTRIATPDALAAQLKKDKNISTFSLDGLHLLPNNFEVRHIYMGGSTGTGKTVMIRKLLRWIRDRGDKAVIYDKGCTFVSRFYNPATDYILNPFDERSVNWSIWNDANDVSDYENLAAALVPHTGNGDPFWIEASRTIFTNTAYKMAQDNEPCTMERLLELILKAPLSTLAAYLDGTESTSLVSEKSQKTAISIKSVLAAYIKSLRYMEGLDKPDENGQVRPAFSINNWVQDDEEKGFLYLTSNAQQHTSLRPLISMWLSTASTAILSLDENPDRRIWIITDELPSLHQLPDLASTLAEVRKHGGCYLIGFQSYAQFVKIYGQHAADEMVDLLNTRFYTRNPSHAMAKKSSDDLGEQELEISKEQYSYGANSVRDGISLGHQTITRPAVLPSEIMQLDDLQCWLRVFGNYPITKLKFKFDEMPAIARSFEKRHYQSSDQMKELDSLLTHYQLGALTALPEKDRQALLDIHKNQFEGDEDSQQEEETRMQKTISDKEQNDDQDIEKQKQREDIEMRAQLATPDHTEQALHDMDNTTVNPYDGMDM